MKKRISIIIPHYNSVELLGKLVRSIPKDPAIQIIIVDDKSNKDIDKIKELESEIRTDGHIFMYNTTEKKGAGVCRNLALEKADGEWILFADADDYYVDGAFDIINKECDSENDIIYFPPTSVYLEDGKIADRHEKYAKWVMDYCNDASHKNELSLKYKFLIPSCKLIKRELIIDTKFDEVMVSNDVMFSTKVAFKAKNLGVSDKVIYCLTKSSNTLTTRKNKENFETRVRVYIDKYLFLKQNLSTEDFEFLSLNGKGYLARSILDGYGIKEFLWVYNTCKKNGVNLFDWMSLKKDVVAIYKSIAVKIRDMKRKI